MRHSISFLRFLFSIYRYSSPIKKIHWEKNNQSWTRYNVEHWMQETRLIFSKITELSNNFQNAAHDSYRFSDLKSFKTFSRLLPKQQFRFLKVINRDLKNAGTKLFSWCTANVRAGLNKIWPKWKKFTHRAFVVRCDAGKENCWVRQFQNLFKKLFDSVQTLAAEILHRFDCSSKNKPFWAAGVGISWATIAGP